MKLETAHTGNFECLQELWTNLKCDGSNWISGTLIEDQDIRFHLKLFNEGSGFGILGGRVSKFSVYSHGHREQYSDYLGACYFNYDRGFDRDYADEKGLKPSVEKKQIAFNAVLKTVELLDNKPHLLEQNAKIKRLSRMKYNELNTELKI